MISYSQFQPSMGLVYNIWSTCVNHVSNGAKWSTCVRLFVGCHFKLMFSLDMVTAFPMISCFRVDALSFLL